MPKNKSEKYKINYNWIKFYNDDINQIKKSIKKHSKEIISKIKKSSFEEENCKENNQNENLILFNLNNYNNMPSFTKELRRALYSNSEIESFKSIHSNNDNNSSEERASCKNNNDSILEQISEEHMHEDNQTLLQVISEKGDSNNINNFIKENENINCKICERNLKKNDSKKENNISNQNYNYNYNDLLVMISTTKKEVEKIQSKVETAKKIKLLNQSYSCNKCIKRLNIDNSNNSQDNINNYLIKEKNIIRKF